MLLNTCNHEHPITKNVSEESFQRNMFKKTREIVCPVNETDALGYFTKQWVHINEPKASITFKMCVPNGSTFVRKVGYNQSYDECCIPFPTNLLRLEEAQKELVKIRRSYIMYHLIPEFCKRLPIK